MKYCHKYSDKELRELLSNIVILCDTREKKDEHITSWFDEKKLAYQKFKLDFGDYSFMIPANEILGTKRDSYFDKEIIVERKAHLEELSGNLAQYRDRFENEFLRSKGCRKILLIEKGSVSDIYDGKFKTQFKPNSYMASLLCFQTRYKLETQFVKPQHSAQFIYSIFYYHLKELIENG
jgi:ERCC4-type nuclease